MHDQKLSRLSKMGEGKTKSKTSSRQSLLARVTERSLMR